MSKQISITQKALNIWAIILIIWSFYRIKFHFPEWFDEFIAKPLVFILPVYLYIKNIEKENFLKGIQLNLQSLFKDIYLSIFTASIFFISVILAYYLKHKELISLFKETLSIQLVFFSLLSALATSISEEILSRGFILKRLYEESKNVISSVFLSSVLFFILHIPILFTNIRLEGSSLLLVIITDVILSFVVSFIFLERKSLTLPIFIHALYYLSISLFVA